MPFATKILSASASGAFAQYHWPRRTHGEPQQLDDAKRCLLVTLLEERKGHDPLPVAAETHEKMALQPPEYIGRRGNAGAGSRSKRHVDHPLIPDANAKGKLETWVASQGRL